MSEVRITVNGQPRSASPGTSVAGLLASMGVDPARVAIERKRHTLLPNTAGCYTAEEAIRTCRLARELGMADMVKLEVIGDQQTLFPDGAATLEAARVLVKDGFVVLPYCLDDPILAKKL